ncbi:probable G-protein coupled receptor tkr-1 [Mytilus californianus]|uniref:probable G-protein coupled receptor tkr-1 n=1 Tax=Mytilus californianus TaxID=6549 RepID=UPI002246BB59|nr:probable G-protein coupled receptor tkr-1 [Mytilus californianus]
MANVIDRNEVLKNRYSDILLSHTFLILIGTVIGVLGNGATIFVYSCRIKERGERYFIPLLALVDLTACLTISTNYAMNGYTYFYDYSSNIVCCVTTFLQVFASGLSAHILLIISIQRYHLVCKPFGPKMTLFRKRVSLAVACLFTLVYSCPLLGLSGTVTTENVLLNHTINTTTCRLSTVDAIPITIYFGVFALIILCNLVLTTVLCIPVFKKIKITFLDKSKNQRLATKKKQNMSSQEVLETSLKKTYASAIELNSDIKDTAKSKSSGKSEFRNIASNLELAHDSPMYAVQSSKNDNSRTELEENEKSLKESSKSRSSSVKARTRTMFFVIIFVYVISYIPTVVCLILRYTIENINEITFSKGETFAWFYIGRLFIVNHIVNPFIYCYFDVKLKRELRQWCTHQSNVQN